MAAANRQAVLDLLQKREADPLDVALVTDVSDEQFDEVIADQFDDDEEVLAAAGLK